MAIIKLFLQFASVVGGVAATSAAIVSATNTSSEKTKINTVKTQNNFDDSSYYLFSSLMQEVTTEQLQTPPQKPDKSIPKTSRSTPKILVGNYQCVIIETTAQVNASTEIQNNPINCEIFSIVNTDIDVMEYSKIDTEFLKSNKSKIQKNSEITYNQNYMLKIPKETDISKLSHIQLISQTSVSKPLANFFGKTQIIWENGKIKTNKYLTKVIEKTNDTKESKFTCSRINNVENCHFYQNTSFQDIANISFNKIQNMTKKQIQDLSNTVLNQSKILFVDLINDTQTLNKTDIITMTKIVGDQNQTKTLEILRPVLSDNSANNLNNIIVIE